MKGLELEIEIRDYSAPVFYKVLEFIYTGNFGNLEQDMNGDIPSLISLLDACSVYELEPMQKVIIYSKYISISI